MRRRYGTAVDRCPYAIPSPHGPGRVPTFSHYSDEHEAIMLDCAAALARRQARPAHTRRWLRISDAEYW